LLIGQGILSDIEQQWRDFICDPIRPGRFLSNVGRSVVEAHAEPLDLEVLKNFLNRLSGGGADRDLLASAVDLAYSGYFNFFSKSLSALLDALANERIGEDAIVGPGLRGNPLWSRTSVARRSNKILRTQYVTRLPVRSFGLPENSLVRWLVGSVASAINAFEARVGSGALPERLALIRTACDDALSHHWFQEVTPPRMVTLNMIAAAKQQRNPAYRHAAQLAERRGAREVGTTTARWLRTLDLLRANWLAPEQRDDLFELYALTLVLDIVEHELGFGAPVEFGLAVPGRSHVALFVREDGSRVHVFFDQSPHTILGERSRYRDIVTAHRGVLGAARRPDVVVAYYPNGSDRPIVMLLEVKDSRDSAYTSDSIYKAMGYAFDFLSLWDVGPSGPKVALIFPEEIALRSDADMSVLDVTLVSSLDRDALVNAMRQRLGLTRPHNTSAKTDHS
jgi:hypothetical protein